MFVQTVRGTVHDADRFLGQMDRLCEELLPQLDEPVGLTAGTTNLLDGVGHGYFALRFPTPEVAEKLLDWPVMDEWWAQTVTAFTSEPAFAQTGDVVDIMVMEEPEPAGFVQVSIGLVPERRRYQQLAYNAAPALARHIPHLLSLRFLWFPDQLIHAIGFYTDYEGVALGEPVPDDDAETIAEYIGFLSGSWQYLPLTTVRSHAGVGA